MVSDLNLELNKFLRVFSKDNRIADPPLLMGLGSVRISKLGSGLYIWSCREAVRT